MTWFYLTPVLAVLVVLAVGVLGVLSRRPAGYDEGPR